MSDMESQTSPKPDTASRCNSVRRALARSVEFFRKSRGLNQTDLERLAGFSAGQVSRIESCSQWVQDDKLEALANALTVPVHVLFMSDLDSSVQQPALSPANMRIGVLLERLTTSQRVRLQKQIEEMVQENEDVIREFGTRA